VPGDDAGSGGEVLAALVASLRAELTGSQAALAGGGGGGGGEEAREGSSGTQAALARAAGELAAARERIAELEARLRQTPRNSSRPPSSEGLGKRRRGGRCGKGAAASGAGGTGMKAPRWRSGQAGRGAAP
jgi:Family of unknown function (DUF6444)